MKLFFSRQKFLVRTSLIALSSLAFRIYVVATHSWHDKLSGDTFYYHWLGWLLAHGYGFSSPFIFFNDRTASYKNITAHSLVGNHIIVPTVLHPPLFSIYIAILNLIGMASPGSQLISLCILGALNVVLIANFTKRLAGSTAGYIAAFLAGFYPAMWFIDYTLMAEQLTQLLITVIIYIFYSYFNSPSLKKAFLLGLVCSLAALTRGELVLLAAMFFGVVLFDRHITKKVSRKFKIKSLLLFTAGFLIFVGPWATRNILTFKYPELISADSGNLLAISNCKSAYYGSNTGVPDFSFQCVGVTSLPNDETVFDHFERNRGLTYMRNHISRVPYVMVVRVARVLYIYNPYQEAMSIEPFVYGFPKYASVSDWLSSYIVNIMAIVGIVVLKKNKVFQSPLLFLIGIGLFTVIIANGNIRFLVDAQVSIVILSAIGICRLIGKVKMPPSKSIDSDLVTGDS